MRARYGLAALFVAVVAALIVVRESGYLGGRTEGDGPLAVSFEDSELALEVDGDPVEIQYARPRFLSPGVRYRAARLRDGGEEYPRDGALLVGSDVSDVDAAIALRAEEPGFYYAIGFTVDYRRGLRRFRLETDGSTCVAVKRRGECPVPVDPATGPLAEIGGPSDYDDADGAVDITLVNTTGRGIEVEGLDGAKPDEFRLKRRSGRHVRVRCTGETIAALTARVDGAAVDVPLTVPLCQ